MQTKIRVHMTTADEHWSLAAGSSCPVCGAMNLNACRNSVQANDTLPRNTVHVARLNSMGSGLLRNDILPKYNPQAKMLTVEQLRELKG